MQTEPFTEILEVNSLISTGFAASLGHFENLSDPTGLFRADSFLALQAFCWVLPKKTEFCTM
jgi:hypothetical protein